MSEILAFKGQLAIERDKARQLILRLEIQRDSIRELTNPIVSVEKLSGEKIVEAAVEFGELWSQLDEVLAKIALIEKQLGK